MIKTLLDSVLPIQPKPDLNALREVIANSPELQAMVMSLIATPELDKIQTLIKAMQEAHSIPMKH